MGEERLSVLNPHALKTKKNSCQFIRGVIYDYIFPKYLPVFRTCGRQQVHPPHSTGGQNMCWFYSIKLSCICFALGGLGADSDMSRVITSDGKEKMFKKHCSTVLFPPLLIHRREFEERNTLMPRF